MKLKLIKIVLYIILVLSFVYSIKDVSASEVDSQGLQYTLGNDGTFYVVSDCDTSVINVVIPSVFNYLPVKHIGSSAFSECTNLVSINIPDSIVYIGTSAFSGCVKLESVEIPEGVLGIGSFTFYNCHKLKSIQIPNSVEIIGSYAFYECNSLTDIIIPESVKTIGGLAFYNCSSLANLKLPNNLTSVDNSVFTGCSNLTYNTYDNGLYLGSKDNAYLLFVKTNNSSITSCIINDNTKFIMSYAFYECINITSVVIPEGVISIGNYTFEGCSNLTSVIISTSVTKIGSYMFKDCTSLENITLPFIGDEIDKVTNKYLGYLFGAINYAENSTYVPVSLKNVVLTNEKCIYDYTFYNCSNLTSIIIPESVTSIGANVLTGCSSLTSITLPFIGDKIDSNTNTYLGYLFGSNSYSSNSTYLPVSLKEVVITKAKTIDDYAFYGCRYITNIIIPNSVQTIGSNAFTGCISLSSMSVPFVGNAIDSNTNTHFGYFFGAASYSENYSYVPASIKTVVITKANIIDKYAFFRCTKLTNIIIPNSIKSIGYRAFQECSSLESIVIPNNIEVIDAEAFDKCTNLQYNIYNGGCYLGNTDNLYVALIKVENMSLTSINLNDSTRIIANAAFLDCSELASVTMSNNVTKIGYQIFKNCVSLVNVTISENATEIGSQAFANCSSLESIVIPDNVISIDSQAFYCCSSLTSITLSKNIISIGDYVFYNCSNLINVSIPTNVMNIGDYSFANCSNIVEITIPNSVKTIGSNIFSNCTSLTNIILSNTITRIEGNTFYGCSNLKNIVIPESVTSIGANIFGRCTSLENLTIPFIGDTKTNIVSSNIGYLFGSNNYNNNSTYVPPTLKNVIVTSAISIEDYAFYGCSNLTSIVISSDVISMGSSIFEGCTNLESITLPFLGNSVNDETNACLGYMFGYLYNSNDTGFIPETLKEVILTKSKSIMDYAFFDCNNLKNVVIPDSVTYIGICAFSGCNSLVSLTIPFIGYTEEDDIGLGSIFGTSGGQTNPLFVPDSLKEVTITRDTIINPYAFYDCNNLVSISLPNSVTSIEEYAFFNCISLLNITIPNKVKNIDLFAFYNCVSLTDVIIPASVTSINSNVFVGCINIESIIVESGNVVYDSRNNCNAIIETATNELLTGCNNTIIPENIEIIGDSAFSSNTNAIDLIIPNSITTIGETAFVNCRNLNYNEYDNGLYIGNDENPYLLFMKAKNTDIETCEINTNTRFIIDNAFSDCTKL